MNEPSTSIPLWLDTDVGDDIDDALALAVILNSPQLALRGVSTVFLDTSLRVQLTRKILATWNRYDIPVVAGAARPLLQPFHTQRCRQFAVLDNADAEPQGAIPLQGVQALLGAIERQAMQTPGEKLTVLAIGALTNIALALALRPDLTAHIRLYMMGGQGVAGRRVEWNILCDPEAAAMVFASGVETRQISYDITSQVQLEESHLDRIAKHEVAQTQLLWRLIQLWRGDNHHLPYLHDPLAALAIFTDCLRFKPHSATVELCGDRRAMIAYSDPRPGTTVVQVAVEVDAPRAIELFMERLLVTSPQLTASDNAPV